MVTPAGDPTGPGPLSGLRVADFSRVLAGPFATMTLADLGADVVKVESLTGDDTRSWGPPFVGTESAYYLCANRNKRSLAVDLSRPEGREIGRRLVGRCDVVVHNMLPASAGRLGLTYEQTRAAREDVVHCGISGYGAGSARPGYDYVLQAVGGLMSITGEPDGEPMKAGVALVDLFTGLCAVIAVQAALAERTRSGLGQQIDMALYDAQLTMLANVASNVLLAGGDAGRLGNAHPNVVPYQLFRTADAALVVAVGNDRQFLAMCEVLGRPELAGDPSYATNAARVRTRDQLVPVLEELVKGYRAADLAARLEARGVPVGAVRTVAEVLAAPETADRSMIWSVPHPELGELSMVASPLKLSVTPPVARRHPPLLGEHTVEVLTELDYPAAAIDALNAAGVTRGSPA